MPPTTLKAPVDIVESVVAIKVPPTTTEEIWPTALAESPEEVEVVDKVAIGVEDGADDETELVDGEETAPSTVDEPVDRTGIPLDDEVCPTVVVEVTGPVKAVTMSEVAEAPPAMPEEPLNIGVLPDEPSMTEIEPLDTKAVEEAELLS